MNFFKTRGHLSIIILLISTNSFAQNVGIGVTDPVESKLQVAATDSALLLLHNTNNNIGNIKTTQFFKTGNFFSGGIGTVGSGGTYRMGFFTYGAVNPSGLLERLTILDGGNVGIGTITPAAKLEVNGTIKITGGSPAAGRVLTSDAAGAASWAVPSGGFSLPYTGSLASGSTPLFRLTNTETAQGDGLETTINSISSGFAISGVASNGAPTATLLGGVRAANFSTNSNGVGIWAYHAGTGSAVYANTPGGIAGYFSSSTGYGLQSRGKLQLAGSGIGTLAAGRLLKSIDANGNAEWSNEIDVSSANYTLRLNNSSTAANTYALEAIANSQGGNGAAVMGRMRSGLGTTGSYGVAGINESTYAYGAGVYGRHINAGIGVLGEALTAVQGTSISSVGTGVKGLSPNVAIYGESTNTDNSRRSIGVSGKDLSYLGTGVKGEGDGTGVFGVSSSGIGVRGETSHNVAAGVRGDNNGTGPGVIGVSPGTGVYGFSDQGRGVYGVTTLGGTGGYFSVDENCVNCTGNALLTGKGKIGLGISNPNQFLDVNGRMRLYHAAGATSGMWFNNSANGLGLGDGGFLGMNCATPGSETMGFFIGNSWRFDVDRLGNGRFAGVVNASAGFACASDFRYKKNIHPIQGALENVLKIKGVNYDWKQEEFPDQNFTDKTQVGFIAQDLEKIYPEMVFTDAKGYKSVDYARLTPILVEAVKELSAKADRQQAQIDELLREFAKLKKRE
ncbi:MAG: tail fiber domain-containing protein [Chitinophagaceae bacterium]|nr:MAG: tail fiber domain-containing protein [Chitinophagaceae bacterium]